MARPKTVPADAVWCSDHKTWEQSARRHAGPLVAWTEAGKLLSKRTMDSKGLNHGPAQAFHPDGSLEREGRFEHGKRVGLWTFHVGESVDEDRQVLAYLGTPPEIRRYTVEFGKGRTEGLRSMRFYDAEGAELDRWGRPLGRTRRGTVPPATPAVLKRAGLSRDDLQEKLLEASGNRGAIAPEIVQLIPREVLVRDLISQGARVRGLPPGDDTPLHFACELCHPATVQALLEAGADVHARDDSKNTPALRIPEASGAGADDQIQVIRLLLAAGASLTDVNKDGRMLLHEACWESPIEVSEVLLEKMKSQPPEEDSGWTPLHIAARRGNDELIRLLVKRGADPDARDDRGRRPFDLAKEEGHAQTLKLLQKLGASAPVQSNVAGGDLNRKDVLSALKSLKKSICGHPFFEEKRDYAQLAGACEAYFADKDVGSSEQLAAEVPKGRPWWVALGLRLLLEKVLAARPADRTIPAGGKVPLFHKGDLILQGNVQIAQPLLVTGNLTVNGHLSDGGPESVVVVGGDVTAGSLMTDGDFIVDGDLQSAGYVYGYYNDQVLRVGGDLRAEVLIEDEHDVISLGRCRAKHHFPSGRYSERDPRLKKLFVDAVFTRSELDHRKIARRSAQGERVLR